MKKYSLAVFDMDGTILDTLQDLFESMNVILEKHGLPLRSYQEIRCFVGNGIHRLVEQAVPEGTDALQIEAVYRDFMAYYQLHCADQTKPYEGIPELLGELRNRGILTAVVSNKADAAVRKLNEEFFPDCFDASAGDQEGIARKPAPDLVNLVLEQLGTARGDAVYIGDSEVDFATAANSNMDFIGVDWGFRGKETLEKLGTQMIAVKPEDVLRYILC